LPSSSYLQPNLRYRLNPLHRRDVLLNIPTIPPFLYMMNIHSIIQMYHDAGSACLTRDPLHAMPLRQQHESSRPTLRTTKDR
ncbi:unnamed protein product, partial [Onchocerca flexuosa]|uniref:Ovule protein n=1 Tax=Onchocerca flexuosa TaxID=387005 RepID=A0A183H1P3_9BILA